MYKGWFFFLAVMNIAVSVQAVTKAPEKVVAAAKRNAPATNAPTTKVSADQSLFDVESVRAGIVNLIDKAASYLQSHTQSEAFDAFTHDKNFLLGDIYSFVYDRDGYCFADGQDAATVWKNQYDLRDYFGVPIVQEIINEAHASPSGGWATYYWRNAAKITHVKEVTKDGQTFILGAGYYPHSKDEKAKSLVRSAVELFNLAVKQNKPIETVFSLMSYPTGRFVLGDLYLYAHTFDGTVVAHGERIKAVGTNEWDLQDSTGTYIIQEIISKLKAKGSGIWVEYLSKNTRKLVYAERVVDRNGKEYSIACGYYPDVNRDQVVALVGRGFQYMQRHGESLAAREFSKKSRASAFVFGDLFLFVYDMDGICITHGGNDELIGANQWNDVDENGVYYIQELIEKARDGGGWVDFRVKNSFCSAYVEKIDIGLKSYAIGSLIYPVSKYDTMVLLAKSAVGYLRIHPIKEAFDLFTDPNGQFIRGDLGVFVMSTEGICYLYKDNPEYLWKNRINEKDDSGKPYIKMLIEQALRAPGAVRYNLRGGSIIAYVEKVEKDGVTYIVGSDFFSKVI